MDLAYFPSSLSGSLMSHILVVDHDATVRSVVEQFLQLAGHETTSVASGAEALDSLDASPPDLVVTDLSMPEMPGTELRQRAREVAPDIPFVLMSGFAVDPILEEIFDACVPKPLSFDKLNHAVDELTSNRQTPA